MLLARINRRTTSRTKRILDCECLIVTGQNCDSEDAGDAGDAGDVGDEFLDMDGYYSMTIVLVSVPIVSKHHNPAITILMPTSPTPRTQVRCANENILKINLNTLKRAWCQDNLEEHPIYNIVELKVRRGTVIKTLHKDP